MHQEPAYRIRQPRNLMLHFMNFMNFTTLNELNHKIGDALHDIQIGTLVLGDEVPIPVLGFRSLDCTTGVRTLYFVGLVICVTWSVYRSMKAR